LVAPDGLLGEAGVVRVLVGKEGLPVRLEGGRAGGREGGTDGRRDRGRKGGR
jgi:hypothetical protein